VGLTRSAAYTDFKLLWAAGPRQMDLCGLPVHFSGCFFYPGMAGPDFHQTSAPLVRLTSDVALSALLYSSARTTLYVSTMWSALRTSVLWWPITLCSTKKTHWLAGSSWWSLLTEDLHGPLASTARELSRRAF
jgi:hypothetical protein